MCEAIGVDAQFGLLFPGWKWIAWKNENLEYLCQYATDFHYVFIMFRKLMGY